MLHAVIMAGGSGTRFWPASRKSVPKQLLKLTGDRTMLQSTADRLGDLVSTERRMVVTNRSLVAAAREQLPDLSTEAIVGEPCKRDTAPCVGLAAALIARQDPEATMLVMPADHVIDTDAQFQAAVRQGVALIDDDPERIATFGIRPSYPAESFGYIERGKPLASDQGEAFQVAQFREKPDRETAEQYLAAGSFYWNSGIFLWRASTIMAALRKREPEMCQHLDRIAEAAGTPRFAETLESEFAGIQGKSIDYAVMENYRNVVVIEAPFAWDDLGSWQALARMNPSDANGNTVHGLHVGINTHGAIVHGSDDHLIVTIDVDDLIVVRTPQATLVAPKSSEEKVRQAVAQIESRGLEAFL